MRWNNSKDSPMIAINKHSNIRTTSRLSISGKIQDSKIISASFKFKTLPSSTSTQRGKITTWVSSVKNYLSRRMSKSLLTINMSVSLTTNATLRASLMRHLTSIHNRSTKIRSQTRTLTRSTRTRPSRPTI